jgi:hypothetical protein
MYGSSQDAASLLEVIASMDVPFDSPNLLPLPWVTVRGAVDHDLQQRSQSMPSWEGGRKRAHEPAFDFVDAMPLGARDDLRRKMTQRLASAACVEMLGASSDTRTRLTPTHDACAALTEPTPPTGPPSPAASARSGSATPLGARGELRRKMTQRLARSTAATGEPAGPSDFGRLHGSCF